MTPDNVDVLAEELSWAIKRLDYPHYVWIAVDEERGGFVVEHQIFVSFDFVENDPDMAAVLVLEHLEEQDT